MKWINGVGDKLIFLFYILSSPVLCLHPVLYTAGTGSSMPIVLNYHQNYTNGLKDDGNYCLLRD